MIQLKTDDAGEFTYPNAIETTRAPDLITSEMTSLMKGLSVSSPSVRSRITPPGPPGLSSLNQNGSIKFEFFGARKRIFIYIQSFLQATANASSADCGNR